MKWISVSERLPKMDADYSGDTWKRSKHVLGCDKDCGDCYIVQYEIDDNGKTWWQTDSEDDVTGRITHWMPLPKMPNG